MRRGEAALEQQAHRIAFVAERRLHADEHVAELCAQDEQRRAVGLVPARRRAPLRFDFVEPALPPQMIVGRHPCATLACGAEARRVADQRARPAAHRHCRAHRPVAGRASWPRSVLNSESNTERYAAVPDAPALGGKLNSTTRDLALGARPVRRSATSRATRAASMPAARCCMSGHVAACNVSVQPVQSPRQRPPNTIGLIAPSSSGIATMMVASTGSRPRGRSAPLLERLELDRMRGDVGHVEFRQQRPRQRARRCRQGRRPARSRSARPLRRPSPRPSCMKKRSIAGRWSSPLANAGITLQSPRLERRDHAVIVRGVAGQQVGAQQQHADGAALPGAAGSRSARSAMRPLHARVVDADIGIVDRRRGLDAPRSPARPSA